MSQYLLYHDFAFCFRRRCILRVIADTNARLMWANKVASYVNSKLNRENWSNFSNRCERHYLSMFFLWNPKLQILLHIIVLQFSYLPSVAIIKIHDLVPFELPIYQVTRLLNNKDLWSSCIWATYLSSYSSLNGSVKCYSFRGE